jgi:hypothetical protein
MPIWKSALRRGFARWWQCQVAPTTGFVQIATCLFVRSLLEWSSSFPEPGMSFLFPGAESLRCEDSNLFEKQRLFRIPNHRLDARAIARPGVGFGLGASLCPRRDCARRAFSFQAVTGGLSPGKTKPKSTKQKTKGEK